MKKSFFERLVGATEEFHKAQSEEEIGSFPQPKASAKKNSKPTRETKTELIEEEWPTNEEGQLTIDVYQTDTDVVIKSTIAGVKSDNIDISITENMVTIKGKRVKDEKANPENYYYQELYWGPFSRSIPLSLDVDADKARASIKDGVLTIRLPKIEKLKTKVIKVREIE